MPQSHDGLRVILVNYVAAISEPLLHAIEALPGIEHIELIDVVPPKPQSSVSLTYHDGNTLHYGRYNTIPAPLEPEDIQLMADQEGLCLRMLDRGRSPSKIIKEMTRRYRADGDQFFDDADPSFDERRRIYYRHLAFWSDLIKTKKINRFMAVNTPHIVYDYVAYAICQKKRIPCLYFERPLYQGFVMPRLSPDTWPPGLLESLKQPIRHTLSSVGQDFVNSQAPSTSVANASNSLGYRYASQAVIKTLGYANQITPLWRHIASYLFGLVRPKHSAELMPKLIQWRIEKNYIARNKRLQSFIRRHGSPTLPAQRYIYFPLHYQPESSTSPQGGEFVDQLIAIRLLAAACPGDIVIAVKEHPAQKATNRDIEFYRDLLNTPNVQLLKTEVSTFSLIQSCLAVATISGTAGWEALFRGKPVICMGYNIMALAPGAYMARTLQDCKDAIARITAGDHRTSTPDLQQFLASLEAYSIKACLDDSPWPEVSKSLDIDEKKSIQNTMAYIKDWLRSEKPQGDDHAEV